MAGDDGGVRSVKETSKSTLVDGAVKGVYGIEVDRLVGINEGKRSNELEKVGGVEGLAIALETDLRHGLDPSATGKASIESHREVFGPNTFAEVTVKSFFALVLENIKDPIIRLLIAAALVSTILGLAIEEERKEKGWIEGVALWVAVGVVALIGAGNDYQKDQQFCKLNKQKEVFDVTVIRGGKESPVKSSDLVVGDILVLNTGDRVTADGVLFEAHGLVIDEPSLTGEIEPIKKKPDGDLWCRSGTQVTEGSGKVLLIAVGQNSEWGKTLSLVTRESDETPLQERLGTLVKLGLLVAVRSFAVLLIRWMAENNGFPISKISEDGPIQFFLFAVMIVVVAVPKGLPLAVIISLAYSMKKMMRHNNFVQVLAACKTMGGATAICSDKTDMQTENRMTVVAGWFQDKKYPNSVPAGSEPDTAVKQELELNSALNSKRTLSVQEQECLLQHLTYNQHLMAFLQKQLEKVQKVEAPREASKVSKEQLEHVLKRGRKLIQRHSQPFNTKNFYRVKQAKDYVQELCNAMAEIVQEWDLDPHNVFDCQVPKDVIRADEEYLYVHLGYVFMGASCSVNPLHEFWEDIRKDHESQVGKLRIFSEKELRNQEKIADGGMACVYSAEWNMSFQKVAIKKLLPRVWKLTMEEFADFFKEASFLDCLKHPHIVVQYGITKWGWMILELADTDLRTVCYLNFGLGWHTKLRLLQHAASGLQEMHDRNLIHHDVKTSNYLIFGAEKSSQNEWLLESCVVKLADFGLTIEAEGGQATTMRTAGGTLEYIAPEADSNERLTLKSDVFSFGVVMFEVVSGKRPYGYRPTAHGLLVKKQAQEDPCTILEGQCPPAMLELMKSCIALKADARPTMAEIANRLCSMPNQ